MDIYNASLTFGVLKRFFDIFKEPVNVLLSMALLGADTSNFFQNRHMVKKLILDSGAWSVARGRSTLKLNEYIMYLKLNHSRFDAYFNFDTDFSDKGFKNNIISQTEMEEQGLRPIPVVHNLFDDEIDYYLQDGHKNLALGSSQITNKDNLEYATKRIKALPGRTIHWFGGSKESWLIDIPVDSCDTSSWAKTGAYGSIKYFNKKKTGDDRTDIVYVGDRMKNIEKNTYHYVSYPWRHDLDEYLKNTFGFKNPLGELTGYDDAVNKQIVNLHYYVELEKRVVWERKKRLVKNAQQ